MAVALLAGMILAACQPAQAPAAPQAAGGQPAPSPRQQKTLIVASGYPHGNMGELSNTSRDVELISLVNAALARQNLQTLTAEAWLAEELPSQANGSWVVNADGTMVTTYHLRPGIKWHDGVPLSSKDFALGWEVARDPKIPFGTRTMTSVSRVETPDDRTLILYWTEPYNQANALLRGTLPPLPRHLLEEPYRANPDQFANLPYFTTQFVGTGPYRMLSWQPDDALELEAVEDFALGRPKIDRIVWRWIFDVNATLSNVLTNNVDVVMRNGFTIDTALVAKQQWEARGDGVMTFAPTLLDWVQLSPLNPWLTDMRVKQAALHAIDRQEIVDTVSHGLETVADVPLSPNHPLYARARAAAPSYAYDPNRARQLLAEAGWTPGADGVLANDRGERFAIEATAYDSQSIQVQSVVIDYWKRIGITVQINNLTPQQAASEQYRGQYTGAYWWVLSLGPDQWPTWFANTNIPTAEKRYAGSNTARWDSASKETALKGMATSLDVAQQNDAIVEVCRIFAAELPYLPMKYQAEIVSQRKGVTNIFSRPAVGQAYVRTWNAEQWDIS